MLPEGKPPAEIADALGYEALLRKPAEVKRLRFRILIESGNAGIQNRSLHVDHLSQLNS